MNDTRKIDSIEHRKLLTLLGEALDAMSENSVHDRYPQIAADLVGEALSSASRQGLLPMASRFTALASCRDALSSLPPAARLGDFRRDAQAALRESLADIGL